MQRITGVIPVSFAGCFLALLLALAPVLAGTGAKADEVTFELRIENGRVSANMRLIRVKQGDVVKLRWSTDQTTILHLHGYDIEVKVEPGAMAEMSFTARATGRFPVSVHKPKQGGDHTHDPPLVHVEVHPR
jgi:FtsP/CotA-like multicopper oxidase with cupredoxin domain